MEGQRPAIIVTGGVIIHTAQHWCQARCFACTQLDIRLPTQSNAGSAMAGDRDLPGEPGRCTEEVPWSWLGDGQALYRRLGRRAGNQQHPPTEVQIGYLPPVEPEWGCGKAWKAGEAVDGGARGLELGLCYLRGVEGTFEFENDVSGAPWFRRAGPAGA